MTQLLIVIAVAIAAGVIGTLAAKRAPDAPAAPAQHEVPTQIARNDFAGASAPWLVAVFTSATCETCKKVIDAAQILDSAEVAVTEVEVDRDKALHDRYNITAVPLVIMANADGVVQGSFLGPPSAADLWAKLAELREAEAT